LGNRGSIIDRTYSYDIHLSNKDWDKIEKLFLNEMQKRTKKIEERIISNVKHSLDNIYSKINKDIIDTNEKEDNNNRRKVGENN
jgi:hypothetical protein